MTEMMFGSGSPVWTTMPSIALAYQPIAGVFGNRAIAAPLFSSSGISGGIGGGPPGGPALTAPGSLTPSAYGSAGAVAQPNLAGSGLAMPYPFVANPLAPMPMPMPMPMMMMPDAAGLVTAPSLLAAVAMRRGQPQGPTNDSEIEEFIYDALELLTGAGDVDVRCENGRVTLTGSVQHKRTKRDVGEIAWAIPVLHDVQNNVSIVSRRRTRTSREAEAQASASSRKQG